MLTDAVSTPEDPRIEAASPQAGLRIKAVGWMVAGNSIAALAQWLYLAASAKLAGINATGVFAYSVAVCAPIVMLTGLQMRALQASDVSKQFSFAVYFSLRIISAIAAVFFISLAAILHFKDDVIIAGILATGIAKVSESFSETIHGSLQSRFLFAPIGKSLILRNILGPLAFTLVIFLWKSVSLAIFAMAATTIAVLVLYDFRWTPVGPRITKDRAQLKALFQQALPLGFTSMLLSAQAYIPRYVLKAFAGDYAVGIFASLAQLPMAAAILVRALGESSSPMLARHYREQSTRKFAITVVRLLAIVAGLFTVGGIFAAYCGRPFLRMLYTEDHTNYLMLLFFLITAECAAQSTAILGYAATASRALRQQPFIIMASIAVLLGSGIFLTREFGLNGMAVAVLTGNIVMLLAYAAIIRSKVNDVSA